MKKTPSKTESAAKATPRKAAAAPKKAAAKKAPAKPAAAKKSPVKKAGGSKPAAKPAAKKPAAKKAVSQKAVARKGATRAPGSAARKSADSGIDPRLERIARAALEDLKAQDIKVLDVRSLTTITDLMVICTGTSNRHVKAIANSVLDKAREAGLRPLGVEGLGEGEWVLVNLGGAVVHVMQAQARAFYQLEKLWDLATPAG